MIRETLPNGIRLVAEHMPYMKSVAVGISVETGSRHEPIGKEGISHFTEHMLFKGTKIRTAKDISSEFDNIGADFNAYTSHENTQYYAKVFTEHLPNAVDLLSDMILKSTVDPLEMSRERSVILEEISMMEDDPDSHAYDEFHKKVWAGTPLGHSIVGTRKTVKAITRDDVLEYMATRYVPSNMIVSVAGNFNPSEIRDVIEKAFKSKKRKLAKAEPFTGCKFGKAKKHKDIEQTHVYMGLESVNSRHKDGWALMVMNALFGAGMSSRLFTEVRENRGLAYSVCSFNRSLSDTGLQILYAAVNPSKVDDLIKVLRYEMDRLATDGVKEEEVAKARAQCKGALAMTAEGTVGRMNQLIKMESIGQHCTIEQDLVSVASVTPEDVLRVAQLLKGKQALYTLGPKEV